MVLRRRDGLRCWLCHSRFHKLDPITLDHAIPKSRGGSDSLHNLRLAHASCNNSRGALESAVHKPASLTRALALATLRLSA